LALTLNFPAALIHSPQWVVAVFGVFAAFKVIAASQMQRASFQSFNIAGALGQKNGVMASFHKLSREKHTLLGSLSLVFPKNLTNVDYPYHNIHVVKNLL